MNLRDRLEASAARRGIPVCGKCGLRHEGAGYAPSTGWHDATPQETRPARFPAKDLTGSLR